MTWNATAGLPLTGIVPPLVTPLLGRDELDIAGLERLIEHVIEGGVSALFILGTTGEGPSLSYPVRRELIDRTCWQVRERVPVVVGITDTSFVESVRLARHAASAGAQAVVCAPPYYLAPAQAELQEYFDHLVAALPLPLILYNTPDNTKVNIDLETVRRLMDQPRVLGLKDSSRNMIYFHRAIGLLGLRRDWFLLIGPEELLAEAVLAGAHGGVSGGANLFPKLYVRLAEVARAGMVEPTRLLHAQVMRISNSLYRVGRHPSSIIKGIKCALACLGVCGDFMAEPCHRFRAEEHLQVERLIATLVPEVEKSLAAAGEIITNGTPAATCEPATVEHR